jgi:H+/Cl- antiporter ClcA
MSGHEAALLAIAAGVVGLMAAWAWSLVDIIRNRFVGHEKIVWLIVVIFVPVLGAVLYGLIGHDHKIEAQEEH